jgi:peptidyl-prolyl cis-trans isomerase C
VGEESITVADFQRAREKRGVADDPAALRALLDELVLQRAQIQEARRRGLDRDPEIVAAYENLLATKLREQEEAAGKARLEVSAAEEQDYYALHRAEFTVPSRQRVAVIFVEAGEGFTPEKRAERRALIDAARAEVLTAQLPALAGFGAIAAKVSFDQNSKFRGGDIGWYTAETPPEEWEPAVWRAGLALTELGQVSEIIETPRGYAIVRLTERAPGGDLPWPQAQAQIRAKLAKQKQADHDRQVREATLKGQPVQTFADRLSALPKLAPAPAAAQPPPLPAE